MALGDAAFSTADIMRRMKRLEDQIRELRGGHRLESSTIGKGGLRVKGTGGLNLENGGGLTVFDGGSIRARYSDGSTAVVAGPIYDASLSVLRAHGFLVQDDLAGEGRDIFRAYRTVDSDREVIIGENNDGVPSPIQRVLAWTEFFSVFAGASATIESGTGNLFLRSTNNDVNVQAQGPGTIWLQSDNDVQVEANGGSIWLKSLNNATHIEHVVDTGLTANTHIGGDGRIFSTASSRRYKTDIADAEIDPDDVLQLQPRVWRDKTSGKPGVGFIAEEIAEIPGMDQFVVYDDEGPQSIAYDRLTAALVPVVQRQQQQIDDLTATVGALAARLDALEASP